MNKRICITGACGYVGSALVPQLLDRGYHVVAYDIGYFGSALPSFSMPGKLDLIFRDIRDIKSFTNAVKGCETVIHLAAISNDASFLLDENLSKTVNYECFEPLVLAAKNNGVKRFIYASTSSVYGVSDALDVTEDHPLVPLTLYNKLKGDCEPLLFKHQSDDFTCVVIRPATVCGYSPRMRFDLSVNILTNHAVSLKKITVFGGSQMRPNLHIKDMCDLYELMVEAPKEKIAGEIFNAGSTNLKISDIAEIVRETVEGYFGLPDRIPLETTPSNDIRSYHISSEKIARVLGFAPKRSVREAVIDIVNGFQAGKFPNSLEDSRYYNVRRMKEINAK